MVPTFLAVTVLAAAACPGGDKTTMTEATEAGSTAATAAPTDGATTSATDTGDTTGGLPDCEGIDDDMTTCQATPGCAWDPILVTCVADCDLIEEEATCLATNYCLWFDGDCFPPL